jgi:hypothetical protein
MKTLLRLSFDNSAHALQGPEVVREPGVQRPLVERLLEFEKRLLGDRLLDAAAAF